MHDCAGLTHLRENIDFDASTLQSGLVFPLSLAFTILFSAHCAPLHFMHTCIMLHCPLLCHRQTPTKARVFIYSFLCECYLSPTITLIYKVRLKGWNKGSERILSTLLKASAGWHMQRRWLKQC